MLKSRTRCSKVLDLLVSVQCIESTYQCLGNGILDCIERPCASMAVPKWHEFTPALDQDRFLSSVLAGR